MILDALILFFLYSSIDSVALYYSGFVCCCVYSIDSFDCPSSNVICFFDFRVLRNHGRVTNQISQKNLKERDTNNIELLCCGRAYIASLKWRRCITDDFYK